MSLFEQASRLKLRFDTPRGPVTTEDLWDLPLTSTVASKPNLDDVARQVFSEMKDEAKISFVETSTRANPTAELKLEIVKYVIAQRQAENAAALDAKTKKERRQAILGIIEAKKAQQLTDMSLEDLTKLLETT